MPTAPGETTRRAASGPTAERAVTGADRPRAVRRRYRVERYRLGPIRRWRVGSIRIAGTWRTTAPAADVWAVVVDLGTWPSWWPAIQDVELTGGEPGEPDAARFAFDTPSRLPSLRLDLGVVEREPPIRLLVRADDGPLTGEGLLTVTTDDGATSTSFDLDLSVRSRWLRPLERVLAGASRSGGRERLAKAGDDLARLAGGEPLEHRL